MGLIIILFGSADFVLYKFDYKVTNNIRAKFFILIIKILTEYCGIQQLAKTGNNDKIYSK